MEYTLEDRWIQRSFPGEVLRDLVDSKLNTSQQCDLGAIFHALGYISPHVVGNDYHSWLSPRKTTSEALFWIPQSNKYPDTLK